jgi:hypothetical protein
MIANEPVFRHMFERYCREGTRPYLYALKRLAGGEYVSHFTEEAWKVYWRGVNDYFKAHFLGKTIAVPRRRKSEEDKQSA